MKPISGRLALLPDARPRPEFENAMSFASLRRPTLRAVFSARPWRRASRWLAVSIGYVLIVVGALGAVLPFVHYFGIAILAVGLVLVLRSSFRARRQFIGLQRRHPKIVFPIRRLLRREPEVIPVAWHQLLRAERWVLPRRWRFLVRMRRGRR